MHLSMLRLHGFKSFAGVTQLKFPPGLTAVVGPNGSGKSNISDAIRWVLGEQSLRALRGVRAQDVIFAGNGRRRPLGFADVTLHLDNSDGSLPLEFSEVAISRRVYQSGEGEYGINGTPCRMRDIQELLMDTGLGRGGLFVVGQGEIDAVLSARPEDRRMLIEELARVAGYRARRERALERLEAAKADRLRVADLLGEVRRRCRELESEAEEANRYRELQRRLRDLRCAYLRAWFRRIRPEWEEARARMAELEARTREQERILEDQEAAYAAAVAERDECEARFARSVQALREHEQAAAELRHQREVIRVRLARLEEEAAQAGERLADYRRQLEEEEAERRRAAQALDEVRSEATALAREVAELHRRYAAREHELEQARQRLEALRNALMDKQQEVLAHEGARRALEGQRASLEQQRQRWEQELAEADEELAQVAQEFARARERLAELEREQRELEAAGRELAAAMQQARSEFQARREALQRLQQIQERERARLDALAAMEQAGEGYQAGVRAVLQHRAQLGRGVIGPVAQLIEVEERWQAAVEAALGGAMEHIVTESDRDAQAAIALLKAHKAGRATFLPLNLLRPAPLPQEARKALQQPGIVGIGSDLVRAPAELQPAILYLLGRVLVAETLQVAIEVSKGLPGSVRIVTLEGDVVSPGGAVTGGAYERDRRRELLTRRRVIAALERSVAQRRDEIAEAERQLQLSEKKMAELESRRRETEARKERVAAERRTYEHRMGDLQASHERLLVRKRRAEDEARGAEAAHERAGRQLDELQEALAAARRELEALQEEAERLRARVEEDRHSLGAAAPELQEAQARLAALQQREAHLAEDVKRAAAAAERTRRRIAEEQERASLLEAERSRLVEALQRAEREGVEREGSLQVARREMESVESAWKSARERAQAVEKRLDGLRKDVARLRQSLHKAESRLQEAEHRLHHLRSKAQEWGFSLEVLEEGDSGAEEERGAGELEAEAAQVEEELAKMTAVNLAAPEQLEQARQRERFLEEQARDLEAAEANLRQAVAEIDRISTRLFRETFEAVQEAFRQVFAELFEGGECQLSLTDPDQPLAGGVDIHVRLPGKPSRHLLQLSGGERALVAIAFIMSMMRVRPVPFCVLDEVDASLDEVNLARFTRLLRAAARQSQIIAITHRRPTMEVADALYGVTMQEPGVSTLVSLSLEEVS